MRAIAATGLLAFALWSSPTLAQRFDNNSVIALHRAGLGEAAIVAKINSLSCGYDVSTDAMIALGRAGVSDKVVAAMVDRCNRSARAQGTDAADPAAVHAPGIYLMDATPGAPRMQPLRPSKASGIKVSGNGSILLPFVGKLVLPDDRSHVSIGSHRPTFYFYFPAHDRRVSDFGTPGSIAAQSPDEFSLVRFRTRSGAREVSIGRMAGFSGQRGIDPRDTIRFSTSEVGDEAYRVEMNAELAPGEYAFVLTGANGTARVYDFTIL